MGIWIALTSIYMIVSFFVICLSGFNTVISFGWPVLVVAWLVRWTLIALIDFSSWLIWLARAIGESFWTIVKHGYMPGKYMASSEFVEDDTPEPLRSKSDSAPEFGACTTGHAC